jgi:GMP reductase
MEKQLGYSDISLKPQKCIVNSRSECDTSVEFGGRKFIMPIYPSNMVSVVNEETCVFMAENNYFYTMHRFGIDTLEFCRNMKERNLFTSISVGVNEDSYEMLGILSENDVNPDYITIDVANAWSAKTKKMVDTINMNFDTFLIVGNIATGEAVKEMHKWPISAFKIGISGGKVCITKSKTGVARSMISTIQDCCMARNFYGKEIKIIADGGIVEHGDIAKAIVCQADMVMAGHLFCGYEQSSGEVIEIEGIEYKQYYGSASKYNKEEYRNIEGKKILVRYRGDMKKLLKEMKEDLQSSISYLGKNSLKDISGSEIYYV